MTAFLIVSKAHLGSPLPISFKPDLSNVTESQCSARILDWRHDPFGEMETSVFWEVGGNQTLESALRELQAELLTAFPNAHWELKSKAFNRVDAPTHSEPREPVASSNRAAK